MLNATEVFNRSFTDCMQEMYAKAQPPLDYAKVVEDLRTRKLIEDPKSPIHQHHYLSSDEFTYILDKYVDAYGFRNNWREHLDTTLDYVVNGGLKDVYIKGNGEYLGHKGTEKVAPLKEQFLNLVKDPELAKQLEELVVSHIKCCQNFYRGNQNETRFRASIALGASPTSNKEAVIQYWNSLGKPITIVEHDHFWERDYYGNDFVEDDN